MRRALNGNPPITTKHGTPGWGYFGRHCGYDYGVNGAQVVAPESGTVINVYPTTPDGGNIIELQGQYTHRFLHLKSIQVAKGNKVAEGQVIGISGATGKVTGPHLHHDVRKNGTAWNASYANYIDWEKLIAAQGGSMETIPNQPNYFARYNKAMQRIRGRSMSQAEFEKFFVGNTHLRMLEAMLDNPEADAYYTLGQWAKANKGPVETRIKELEADLAEAKNQNTPPAVDLKWHEHLVLALRKLIPLVKEK